MKGSRYNMSKKSARSKGYRTYKTEQKGFSKGELKTLIIAAVVLVLAIAAIIILPDAIEARHLIKVKDGALQGVEDNWLVLNVGTSSHPKYRKIAEVDPAEGYSFEKTDHLSSLNLSTNLTFKADDEQNAVADTYVALSSANECKALAEKAFSNIQSGVITSQLNVLTQSDKLQTCDVNGVQGYWYTMNYSSEVPAEEEGGEATTKYSQNVYLYLPAGIKDTSVILSASNTCESEEEFGDVDAMLEMLKEASTHITMAK